VSQTLGQRTASWLNAVGRSVCRIGWPVTDKDRAAAMISSIFLHIHPARVSRHVLRPTATLDFVYPTLGDLGAAVMPTGVVLAIEGMRRGAPAARSAVVTGSSDGGARGVVLVAAAPAE